jgi:hypothetical protein
MPKTLDVPGQAWQACPEDACPDLAVRWSQASGTGGSALFFSAQRDDKAIR